MPRMTRSRRLFLAWQDWLGFTVRQMANMLVCSKTMIVYLRGGQRCPGRELAVRIAEASRSWPEGPIEVADWYCHEEEEEAAA